MYTKQASKEFKEAFWTAFGRYMAPVPSAAGTRINWVNYKTGEKHIYFKMDADHKKASISIELSHPSTAIRAQHFETFMHFSNLFRELAGEGWTWTRETADERGRIISRIYSQLEPSNIFVKTEWPAMISFLKTHLIALDSLWNEIKFAFEEVS